MQLDDELQFALRTIGVRHEHELLTLVAMARKAGWSWARIGKALGVSRQTAHERFAERINDDDAD